MPRIEEQQAKENQSSFTEAQRNLFLKELKEYGSLDGFLIAKRSIIIRPYKTNAVLKMPLERYCSQYAKEYRFEPRHFNSDFPILLWKSLYSDSFRR